MVRPIPQFKTATGTTPLTLTAKAGQSLLVTDVWIKGSTTSYATFTTGQATVGYWRVGGGLGNHLHFPRRRADHSHDIKTGATTVGDVTAFASFKNAGGVDDTAKALGTFAASSTHARLLQTAAQALYGKGTLLDLLVSLGVMKGYPVGQGQTFSITGVAVSGAVQCVKYLVGDVGDFTPDMPNGSAAKEFTFVNYGNSGATINTTGDSLINTAVTPAQFPAFPFGSVVPPNTSIDLIGILASDVAPAANDGTDYTLTTFLKLVSGRVTLMDDDLAGLLLWADQSTSPGGMDIVGEGQSIVGNFSDVDCGYPFWFDPALTFNPGEELNVYLTTAKTASGKTISLVLQEVGLILRAKAA